MADATAEHGFSKIWHWAEKHPYATGGIVFAVGAVIVFLYYSGGSGSSGTSSASANYQSSLAAQVQLAQIAAQAGAVTTQANDQAAVASQQVAGAVTVANDQAAAQEYLGGLSAQVQTAGIAATQAVQTAGLQTQAVIASTQAGQNEYIAGLQVNQNEFGQAQQTFQQWINAYTLLNQENTLLAYGK